MNKSKRIIALLCLMVVIGTLGGYQVGSEEKKDAFDKMLFLIQSDRNLVITNGIEILESLKANNKEVAINEIHLSVKSYLSKEGVYLPTIEKAREYQQKYCVDACLGVTNK